MYESHNRDIDEDWVEDSPSNIPYLPYDPAELGNKPPIYVRPYLGEQKIISEDRKTIQPLTEEYYLIRYYYPGEPAELRKGILDICSKILYNS